MGEANNQLILSAPVVSISPKINHGKIEKNLFAAFVLHKCKPSEVKYGENIYGS